jgi:release factor glutamine methyltransferase
MKKSVQDIIDKAMLSLKDITHSPQREACLLMAHVLKASYEDIYFEKHRLLMTDEEAAFNALLERRLNHEPLSKIREYREFWSLTFRVTPDTLDPRPDSETLIEAALDNYPDKTQSYRILDLGTGTGCLLLSLLSEYPNATGVGVDYSEAAAQIAQENAIQLKLNDRAFFLVGIWGEALGSTFDIIISNPPYIGKNELLPREVEEYDPSLALIAGEDGLDCYRELADQFFHLASPSANLFLELGNGQLTAVKSIFSNSFFKGEVKDLQGKSRCAIFCSKTMPVD